MLELSKIYINFIKRERNIGICNVISKLVGKKKTVRKGWRYILWNATYYKKRIKICAFENVCIFSQIFISLKNPLKFGMHDWWQILFVAKRLN
jgi:hypothetical protein